MQKTVNLLIKGSSPFINVFFMLLFTYIVRKYSLKVKTTIFKIVNDSSILSIFV